jgi:PEP-CTERM motif-containing protein
MSPQRSALALTLLIVALCPMRGEAGLIPWSYQWSAEPTVVDADPLGPHHRPTGGITLTPGAIAITGGNPGVALGSAAIVAVNLAAFAFSPRPDGKPYSFTNASYRLGITLTDVDSNKAGTLHFAGVFDGDLTDSTVNLHTHFTSTAKQSLVLGHNHYTVSLTSYTPPDPPAEGGAGNISALVNVSPASAPEPSTLVLAGMGLAGAVFSRLRRRTLP